MTGNPAPRNAQQPARLPPKPRYRDDDDYRVSREGRVSHFGRGNNKILRPDAEGIKLMKPQWEKGMFPTTLRLMPAMDPDTRAVLPYRLSGEPDEFSDFYRTYSVANFVGLDMQVSFIMFNPAATRHGYDQGTNPYQVLVREIADAVKEGTAMLGRRECITPKWFKLGPKGDSKKKALTWPKKMGFAQAFVYTHEEKTYRTPLGLGPKDPGVIMEFPESALGRLVSLMNLQRPGYTGPSDDYARAFKFGDITNLATGRFITLYNPQYHKNLDRHMSLKQESVEFFNGFEYEQGDMNSWRVALHQQLVYREGGQNVVVKLQDLADMQAEVIQRKIWLSDALNVPKRNEMDAWHQQVCIWLASAFRSMPDVLRYAWRDFPEYLNSEVMGVLKSRVVGESAEVPTAENGQARRGERSRTSQQLDDVTDGLPVDEDEESLGGEPIVADDLQDDVVGEDAGLDYDDGGETETVGEASDELGDDQELMELDGDVPEAQEEAFVQDDDSLDMDAAEDAAMAGDDVTYDEPEPEPAPAPQQRRVRRPPQVPAEEVADDLVVDEPDTGYSDPDEEAAAARRPAQPQRPAQRPAAQRPPAQRPAAQRPATRPAQPAKPAQSQRPAQPRPAQQAQRPAQRPAQQPAKPAQPQRRQPPRQA